MSLTFSELRRLAGGTDITDVPCPLCVGETKTKQGTLRKCLRIWDTGEAFISYTCARCQARGFAKPDNDTETSAPIKKQPVQKDDKTALCQYLWDKSQPAIGSIAQTYLQSRQCFPAHMPIAIRFLPGSDKFPPAMISRFGFNGEPLTGVHLTKLLTDGSGKASGDAPKITMGDTLGLPVVINESDTEDKTRLVISEGLEDTLSFTIATGWNAWGAGTAGRIPAVVATAVDRGYRKIYVTQDADAMIMATHQPGAGKRAIEQAASIHPVIPLPLGSFLIGADAHLDVNQMLIKYGHDCIRKTIPLCEMFHEFALRNDWLNCNNEFDRKSALLWKALDQVLKNKQY